MLQCFIVQPACASSTNSIERNDKTEEKLSENTKLSNKKAVSAIPVGLKCETR
jgi:hypothetical protein